MLLVDLFKTRTAYFKSTVFLIIILLALLLINQEAWAKKVNNNTAVSLLTNCMLASDATEKVLPDGSYACCSKSEGFCIWCPTSPNKACVSKPAKITAPDETPPFITTINPAFFNELTDDARPNNSPMIPIKNFILRNKGESVETKKYDSGE